MGAGNLCFGRQRERDRISHYIVQERRLWGLLHLLLLLLRQTRGAEHAGQLFLHTVLQHTVHGGSDGKVNLNEVLENPYEYVYDRSSRKQARPRKEIGISVVRGNPAVTFAHIFFLSWTPGVKLMLHPGHLDHIFHIVNAEKD